MERDDRKTVTSCFSKVFQKKALLSTKIYAEIFDQIPEARKFMQGDVLQQKEGFVSVLIEAMKMPQTGEAAERRMEELRQLHVQLGVTAQQVERALNIILEILREELAADLTAEEQKAWDRVIRTFGLDLAAGLS
ncbi:globin [Parasedimentitalea huanghaiensis]|uniref:Globin domain-containing protein n=1 Tax=Parasedimentitalea huanghaiensis TaxID=2682100 RepID=A0A6L6WI43_9RHOB|nr:globin [Zongyanglinia huanghaiensis]MVO15382.1 hypothetical protein [Zongyanglinia huanghaiensis]